MILSVRRCSTRVALTEAPSSSGVPVETLAPSPTISTSPSSSVAPGSPSSLSTAITSSLATVYCLPPVRITANITGPISVGRLGAASPAWAKGDRAGLPARERRTIVARLDLSMFSGRWSPSAMWRKQLGWTAARILLPWLVGVVLIAILFDRGQFGAVPAAGAAVLLLGFISAIVLITTRRLRSAARDATAGLG